MNFFQKLIQNRIIFIVDTGKASTLSLTRTQTSQIIGISMELESQQLTPFHFKKCNMDTKGLMISVDNTHWSLPFKVDSIGEVDLQILGEVFFFFEILLFFFFSIDLCNMF